MSDTKSVSPEFPIFVTYAGQPYRVMHVYALPAEDSMGEPIADRVAVSLVRVTKRGRKDFANGSGIPWVGFGDVWHALVGETSDWVTIRATFELERLSTLVRPVPAAEIELLDTAVSSEQAGAELPMPAQIITDDTTLHVVATAGVSSVGNIACRTVCGIERDRGVTAAQEIEDTEGTIRLYAPRGGVDRCPICFPAAEVVTGLVDGVQTDLGTVKYSAHIRQYVAYWPTGNWIGAYGDDQTRAVNAVIQTARRIYAEKGSTVTGPFSAANVPAAEIASLCKLCRYAAAPCSVPATHVVTVAELAEKAATEVACCTPCYNILMARPDVLAHRPVLMPSGPDRDDADAVLKGSKRPAQRYDVTVDPSQPCGRVHVVWDAMLNEIAAPVPGPRGSNHPHTYGQRSYAELQAASLNARGRGYTPAEMARLQRAIFNTTEPIFGGVGLLINRATGYVFEPMGTHNDNGLAVQWVRNVITGSRTQVREDISGAFDPLSELR